MGTSARALEWNLALARIDFNVMAAQQIGPGQSSPGRGYMKS
jgi:hypothetical protein